MRNSPCLLSLLALCFYWATPMSSAEEATPMTRQAALERIMKADAVQADWFAESFLSEVPAAQIDVVLKQLRTAGGALQEVKPEGSNFQVIFEHQIYPTSITLDKGGRVVGLLFSPPRNRTGSLEDIIAAWKSLPGQKSVLALENGKSKAALNADERLAVGSAFKLAVLVELKRRIEAGKLKWEDVEPLRAEWKSLPSGWLQDCPDGSPLTLHSYAMMMIAQSDNTATDHLIRLLSAEKIEAVAPHNKPFLTTFEAFKLKYLPAAGKLRERYIVADEAGRRAVLKELEALPLPAADDGSEEPTALEIEWYLNAYELAALMAEVRELPIMGITPGIPNADAWKRVSYKGGSEPGVLCMVISACTQDDREITVIATWNNKERALDEERFDALFGDLLEKMK